jgi:hypothetical protein
MAGRSDQIAIFIGSNRDREKKDLSMISFDQSRFSRYLFALWHILNFIIYKKGM